MANESEPVALAPVTPDPNDTAKYGRRLRTTQIVQIMALRAEGKSLPQIAEVIGCAISSVQDVLSRYESSTALARQFLDAQSLVAAKHWIKASKKGAERGRHEPAKDLLLATGAIQPVQGADSGAKVAVFIGLPSQETPSLLVRTQDVVVEAHTPQQAALEDEGD